MLLPCTAKRQCCATQAKIQAQRETRMFFSHRAHGTAGFHEREITESAAENLLGGSAGAFSTFFSRGDGHAAQFFMAGPGRDAASRASTEWYFMNNETRDWTALPSGTVLSSRASECLCTLCCVAIVHIFAVERLPFLLCLRARYCCFVRI